MFAPNLQRRRLLSQPRERTQKVLSAIKKCRDNSPGHPFRPGDINQLLRDGGYPMGNWEVRAELTELERNGLVELDAASGSWSLTEAGAAAE